MGRRARVGEAPVRGPRGPRRQALAGHVRGPARAPARPDPRPPRPGRPRGDRGHADADSRREQASAGLDRLSPDEYEHFTRTNTAYRERFGFPFVVCVREHDKASILATARGAAPERPGYGGPHGTRRDRQDRPPALGRPGAAREDLLRQAPRPAAARRQDAGRRPRPARLRGQHRGAGRELRRRLHRGRQLRRRRDRHDEELHPARVARLRGRHAGGPARAPRPRLPRHLPGDGVRPHERPRAALRPAQRQAVRARARRPRGGERPARRGRRPARPRAAAPTCGC